MQLTLAQKQALKADIIAASDPECAALEAAPTNSDLAAAVATLYNQTAAPDYFVWRDLAMETVLNTITFASMTPADAVPTVSTLGSNPSVAQQATYDNQMSALNLWRARSLSCQGKQFNLQNLTIGRTTAPMKRTNYRAALQDCLTNIPAGASGANIAANWVGVRDGAKFLATRLEKLLATGAGTQATPSDLNAEGVLSYQNVLDAMAS